MAVGFLWRKLVCNLGTACSQDVEGAPEGIKPEIKTHTNAGMSSNQDSFFNRRNSNTSSHFYHSIRSGCSLFYESIKSRVSCRPTLTKPYTHVHTNDDETQSLVGSGSDDIEGNVNQTMKPENYIESDGYGIPLTHQTIESAENVDNDDEEMTFHQSEGTISTGDADVCSESRECSSGLEFQTTKSCNVNVFNPMEDSSEDWQSIPYKDYDETHITQKLHASGPASEYWAVQESTNNSSLTSLNNWPSTRHDGNQDGRRSLIAFSDIPVNDRMIFTRAKDQLQIFDTGGQLAIDSKNSDDNWQSIEFKDYETCGTAKDDACDNKNRIQTETPTNDPTDGTYDVNLMDMADKDTDYGVTGISSAGTMTNLPENIFQHQIALLTAHGSDVQTGHLKNTDDTDQSFAILNEIDSNDNKRITDRLTVADEFYEDNPDPFNPVLMPSEYEKLNNGNGKPQYADLYPPNMQDILKEMSSSAEDILASIPDDNCKGSTSDTGHDENVSVYV